MMVALLVYAYARGKRSSRVVERGCLEDIAFRVITANRAPDHSTIARFRQRHEAALGEVFGEVLALCADAGLAGVEVLAVDGTKVHANASERATRDYRQLAEEILRDAGDVDAAERRLDAQREQEARPIAASRRARVKWRQSAAWRKSYGPSSAPTTPMRPTGRAG